MLTQAAIDTAVDNVGVGDFDRAVYQALAAYCFDEAVCWPRQELVARDLGCSRYQVTRAVQRLARAGWLKITKRLGVRFYRGRRWLHNVYELLEPFKPVSRWVADRIVERSIWRRRRRVHTNHVVVGPRSQVASVQVDVIRWIGIVTAPN
jgi:DNA-binding transcriptional MocR family regulator